MCSKTWFPLLPPRTQTQHLHVCCLRSILGITWQDRVPNKDVLAQSEVPCVFALLSQSWLRWLGHVSRMDDEGIPRDILYSELATGTRPAGRPNLRFKDICKQDLKAGNINTADWEVAAADQSHWRLAVTALRSVRKGERRERSCLRAASVPTEPSMDFIRNNCNRACRSRIGLYIHSRRCNSATD